MNFKYKLLSCPECGFAYQIEELALIFHVNNDFFLCSRCNLRIPDEEFWTLHQDKYSKECVEDPYYSEEYQKFVESMVEFCDCEPSSERPCDGVLAGGPCDQKVDNKDWLDEEPKD
jgi:hypothetical protein